MWRQYFWSPSKNFRYILYISYGSDATNLEKQELDIWRNVSVNLLMFYINLDYIIQYPPQSKLSAQH